MSNLKPINNPVTGFNYLLRGLGMLNHSGLRRFVLVPLLINIVVFSLVGWGGYELFSGLMDEYVPSEGWLSYFRWLLWPLFAIAGLLTTFYTFTVIANLIAAPFNGLLAEKVETLLTGKTPTSPGGGIMKDLIPSITSEIHKLLYFLLRAIPLLILFVIPVINIAAPFLWIAFSAWFLFIEYADFPLGNRGLKFKQELQLLKRVRFTGLGFGGGATLMLAIPVINFVAMPAAVVGATIMWCEQRDALTQN